ncbi:MAG: hypothetical protein K0V04_42515 [Deltaproteobacteria bacterium]|nr:hypothetical protein [Deltaproteobacteria bacterium]
MARSLIIVVALLACLWPTTAAATTGGNEPLEVLGYAPGDGKVYLLRQIDDGSEALPMLYFAAVDGPHAGRVFEVASWYRELDDPDVDHDAAVERFWAKLARLRKRLRPVKTIEPLCTTKVVVTKTTPVDDPWDPAWDTRYELDIAVTAPGRGGKTVHRTVTAYSPTVDIAAEIRVPGKAIAVVLVRYFSMPYEHGYHSDIAVGIPLGPRAIRRGVAAPAVPYHPYSTDDG